MENLREAVLVFGASGAIGGAITQCFLDRGWEVYAVGRNEVPPRLPLKVRWSSWDLPARGIDSRFPDDFPLLNAVVWAQGANCNDDIFDFDRKVHDELYAANVTYILVSLNHLLKLGILAPSARLCIISSIWQNIARQQKLSYTVTKSALRGLVQSLSIDLGASGTLVNAILPGALDTPMTRANLSVEQIKRLESLTPLGKLPALEDVCNLVGFLCSKDNTGITGQFVAADRGFSNARIF